MKIRGNVCILLRNYFILGREIFFYGLFLISKFIIIVRGNKFL